MGRISRYLALLALLWPGVLSAQQRAITGRVTDAMSGQPLASVSVTVVETRQSALTDAEGRFRLAAVPSERVTLRFSSLGYRTTTVTVEPGTTSVEVGLDIDA